MKSYTKIYLYKLGYVIDDFIPCEVCSKKGVDIHHIFTRKKFPELLNKIENLMSLCRKCHQDTGDKKEWMYFLLIRHYDFLLKKGVEFDKSWFDEKFNQYADADYYI